MAKEEFMMHVRERIYDRNGNRREDITIPFTEDNFFRCMTNIRLGIRAICQKDHIITQDDSDDAWLLTEEACSIMRQLEYNLHTQFKQGRVRKVCANPNCHSIYAIFYDDFLYCPKCGTKLIVTKSGPIVYPASERAFEVEELITFWNELGDIPVDDYGIIQESFLWWPKGTDREDIWHWFDEKYPGGVVKLMGLEKN